MILSLLISLLVVILVFIQNNKEGFFFEVSQPQPKCEKGYYGKNVKFEYTQPGNQNCEN
jgi:hypothetical protein